MASPAYPDPDGVVRLVVLGDSTAFTGPNGPLLPDEPALYPNVAARRITEETGRSARVTVLAHPGAGVRGTWYDVTKNRHVMFEVLMRADALVVGIGSFDHAPAGVPPALESLLKYLPNPAVRRNARALLRALHPWGVRATAGRFTRIGTAEFERLFDRILHESRSLSWGAPAVVLGPTSHRSPYYGHVHPQHAVRERLQAGVAERHHMPFVPVWPLVEPFAEKLNSDGIHWPFEAHEAVGEAAGAALAAQILRRAPRPGIPGFEETTR